MSTDFSLTFANCLFVYLDPIKYFVIVKPFTVKIFPDILYESLLPPFFVFDKLLFASDVLIKACLYPTFTLYLT